MGAGQFRRCLHFLVRRVQPAVPDILPHRAGEQMGILQHHCDVLPQPVARIVLDILPVDGDLAFFDIVEPVQQVCNRGLSRAGGADKGNLLSRMCVERNILQYDLLRHIAEGHMLHHHVPADLGRLRAFPVRNLRFRVHHGKHAFRAGQGRQDRCRLLAHLVNRHGELPAVPGEYRQCAGRQAASTHQDTAHADCDTVADLAHVTHHRAHDPAEELRAELLVLQVLVQLGELLHAFALVVKDLDDLLPGHGFLDIAVHRAQCRLLRLIVFRALLGDGHAAEQENRNEDDGDQCQHPARGNHEHEGADQRDQTGNQPHQAVVDHRVDVVDIVGIPAHQLARRVAVVVAHRQPLHLPEKVVPEILDHPQGDGHHQPRLQIGADYADQVDDTQHDQCHRHIGGYRLDGTGRDPVLHRLAGYNLRQHIVRDLFERTHRDHRVRFHCQCQVVDNRSHQIAAAQTRDCSHQHAQQNQYQPVPVFPHIAQQPFDGLSRVLRFARRSSAGRTVPARTVGLFHHIFGFGGVLGSQPFKTSGHAYAPFLPSWDSAISWYSVLDSSSSSCVPMPVIFPSFITMIWSASITELIR